MEEKIMNMLEQLYIEVKGIKDEVKGLKEGQAIMQNDIKDLKAGQDRTEERLTRIESKVDSVENKLDNMEAQNANRHVEMVGEIEDMKKDMAAVEIITSKNWYESAKARASR